ncbi:MAG TPA: HEAT repeat domain-containing protein [Blastocatellia bacterium]
MVHLRQPAIVAAFLTVAISIQPSLFSRPAPTPPQPKQPAPRGLKPKKSKRADALSPAIKELLETNPPAPQSPDKKASEGKASENKPPTDDAPIKELVAYWSDHADDDGQAPKISDSVRRRLLEACEDRPELLDSLTDYLPENADTHDRLYKLLNEEPEGEESWKPLVREWLRRNSAYFRDELIKAALAADDNVYSANEDLRGLARLDWNAARPILETFAAAGKAFVTPLALALLYEHAAQEGDSAPAESYRALLKAIVENRQSSWSARAEALASLMSAEWIGQEEWFVSLFADPTLSSFREDEIESAAETKNEPNVKTDAAKDAKAAEDVEVARDIGFRWQFQPGVLATALCGNTDFHGNADRWLPVISRLVGDNRPTVHKAAVKCLVKYLVNGSGDEKKKEIARLLTPLLSEPDWATGEDRAEFIANLAGLKMPELSPGLIWILDYDEEPDNRAYAAEALAQDRDPLAVPALRRALEKEEGEENREKIVTALAECGGFSDGEMAVAVEAYARMAVTDDGKRKIDRAKEGPAMDKPLPLKISIGRILNDSETIQATEGLAVRLIERAKALRATQPDVAREILRVIESAPLRVVEINLVERIGAGWADVDSITLALETRDALTKSAGGELYDLLKEGGHAAGVAAAILNDEREWKSMLENGDARAQLALLASARYLRDKLPVELAARLLYSPNRVLARAAESYLEIEDSPEARKLVLARHPGEAYALGDLTAISNEDTYIVSARRWEDALRKEMQGQNGLEAVYAVARIGSAAEYFTGVIIRVRGAGAEMSVHEAAGLRNVRGLTESEFDELKKLTSRPEIEDLGPESYIVDDDKERWTYEYLRLNKEGGRRIVLDDLRRAPKNPTLHEELSGLFYRLSRTGEFTARYNIEDKLPGVEVVFADKNQSVLKVCAEGGEMRALIEEKGDEYRRGGEKAAPEWREFPSGKPGEARGEPSACRKLNSPSLASRNATVISDNPFGRPARPDGAIYYQKVGEDVGIWKAEPGMEPVKIVSGDYLGPVITPDGKWLVAARWVTGNEEPTQQLIRRNLRSGEEFVVTAPQKGFGSWIRYIAARGKVLIGFYGESGSGYLLDPEIGTTQPVKGEFRPLLDSFSYALQSAGGPNLFWMAIRDWEKRGTKFGMYDSKNFAFTTLLDFPDLDFDNDHIWVDATAGKIWFTYQGHLLRIPLPPPQKSK